MCPVLHIRPNGLLLDREMPFWMRLCLSRASVQGLLCWRQCFGSLQMVDETGGSVRWRNLQIFKKPGIYDAALTLFSAHILIPLAGILLYLAYMGIRPADGWEHLTPM